MADGNLFGGGVMATRLLDFAEQMVGAEGFEPPTYSV